MNHTQQSYRCVSCYQDTVEMDEDRLLCKQCNQVFPIIDGIPILTRRAHQFVVAQAEELSSVRNKLTNFQEDLAKLSGSEETHAVSDRIVRMTEGIAVNIALMDKQCDAIWKYVKNENSESDTVARAAVQSGYPFEELLPYFYQDWYETKPFAKVVQNIQPAVEAFCNDRDSLAVFGAGACGLLHVLSNNFEKSVGVDLALPGLMMAKHLIEGEGFSMCLDKADWKNIELFPPQKNGKDIRFIAANVMDTPFPDESLSAVVTQYLLDIVPNSEWFIREIRRILKPGGVWINFSKPFTWSLDFHNLGPRRLSEVTPILHGQGFDELQLNMIRFNVLSMEDIFQGGERFDQEVHMFVSRKTKNSLQEARSSIPGRMRNQKEGIWNQVPKLMEPREVAIVKKKIYKTGLQEFVAGIQIRDVFFPMGHDFLLIMKTFLEGIDGKRTVRQLQHYMRELGFGIPDQDFLDLIYCLNVEYYLLELIEKFEEV